jgi:tetratricopeptide (TPR) repeat protein
MIYTTSYALYNDAGVLTNDNVMIKKINPSGTDVLRRNGYTKPKGDNTYFKSNDGNGTYGPSKLDAIAVNDYGAYTVVDSARGRLFTYDNEGNLLYISGTGGSGDVSTNTQIDKITSPVAIEYLGENVLVLDSRRQAIIIFEPTEIAKVINQAVKCEYEGRSDGEYIEGVYVPGAYDYWKQVILLNANYEYAYVGIGKHYMNQKEYKTALENFKLGYDRLYYGKAYKQYRDSIIKKNFAWVAIVLLVIIVAAVVGKAIIGTALFFVSATPARLTTSSNSGFAKIIAIALAVSIALPPPTATTQSTLFCLAIVNPSLTLSTLGFDFTPSYT